MPRSPKLDSRTIEWKPDFDECMARVYAWYEQKIVDRPLVRFHHHNVEYEMLRVAPGAWGTARERWLDAEFQLGAFTRSLENNKFLGETFPVFWPNLSAVVYNLFLGQEPLFDDVTAWIHPTIEDIDNLPQLKVQYNNGYFQAINRLTARALEQADGRFLVGYTDMYAGIDCAAGLLGTEQMCVGLLTHPAEIKRVIDAAFSEYEDVYKHFDTILKSHHQLSVTWMNIPSYQTFNVLACDFAVNVSRDHFGEFCMPVLQKEAELFTHNVFHLDGPRVAKNIDAILTLPNLSAVQWVQGYGKKEPIMQWVELIQKIQDAGKSVIVDLKLNELDEFLGHVDPTGIMLWVPASPNEQPDVINKLTSIYRHYSHA